MGALRPATRTEDTTRGSAIEIAIDSGAASPLVPGEPVVLRFSLTPGPIASPAAETLRLELGSRTDLLRERRQRGLRPVRSPSAALPVPQHRAFRGQSWLEVTNVPVSGDP